LLDAVPNGSRRPPRRVVVVGAFLACPHAKTAKAPKVAQGAHGAARRVGKSARRAVDAETRSVAARLKCALAARVASSRPLERRASRETSRAEGLTETRGKLPSGAQVAGSKVAEREGARRAPLASGRTARGKFARPADYARSGCRILCAAAPWRARRAPRHTVFCRKVAWLAWTTLGGAR
jgi:hypothetical protein